MSNILAVTQIGGQQGGNPSGTPTGAGAPPGNVSDISVSGTVDPNSKEIFLTVTFTVGTGTFTGVHIWLDIPDHGTGSGSMTVGSSSVGTSSVAGPFNPIDLGVQTNPAQPWNISCAFPSYLGLDPTKNIPCRLYIASVSTMTTNQLIQDGQPNATPNAAFTLVSTASGSPTAGTNITANVGALTVQVLGNDDSSGKLMTPFLAQIASVPSPLPTGWGYRLYIYYSQTDTPTFSDLTPVTDVQSVAGIVPASKSDVVTDVTNTFSLPTPTTTTYATIYALSGLTVNGTFTPNNIATGITNGCPVTFGSNTGTLNAAQVMQSSISSELTASETQLGITPSSLTSYFLASSAALNNIGIGGLLASYLASGAALSNLGAPVSASVLISAGTITGTLIATDAITYNLIATDAIISSAQIGTSVIAYSNIGSCSVSSLIAGTATFTSTVLFENTSGPYVEITSTEVVIGGGSYTISANSSTGISIASSSSSLAITSSALSITTGSYALTAASSYIEMTTGSASVTLTSSSFTFSTGGTANFEFSTGGSYPDALIVTGSTGTSTVIEGSTVACGSLTAASLAVTPGTVQVSSGATSSVLAYNSLQIGGYSVINSSGEFVGNGVVCPGSGIECAGVNVYYSGTVYDGQTSFSSINLAGGGNGVCGQVEVAGTYYQVSFGTVSGSNEFYTYILFVGGSYVGLH